MPPFNVALRSTAAVAALAAGTTAGIAAAAVHTPARAHARGHALKHAQQTSLFAGTYAERLASYVKYTTIKHHHPTPPPTTTTPPPTTTTPPPTTTTPTTTTPTTTTPTTTTPTTTTPTTTTPTTTTPTTTTPTTTTPTTTTPTTTTPTTTTPTTTTPSTPTPTGVSGNWAMTFDDEFTGTSLDTSVWGTHDGWTNQNNVTDHASNITEAGGVVTLTLASSTSGAALASNQYVLGVGDFAEARVYFAGSGTTIYNWPAWWASGPNWPAAGENDIAEGLGTLTVNYHSPSGAHNTGTVAGTWSNAFHTYGIYRGTNYCDVYYDGQLVRQYTTDDNGGAEELLFTMGSANTLQFGPAGQMKVDYVRVWAPA